MANTLLNSLTGLVNQQLIDRSAADMGESPQAVRQGFQTGFATILGGLVNRANDTGTMRQVVELSSNRALDDDAMIATLGNPSLENTASTPTATATDLGGRLGSMLFGNRTGDVTAVLAQSAGLRPSSATSILGVASPLVLAVIARRVRDGGLTGSGLSNLLLGQRDSIMRALPPGMADVLGVGAPADREVAAAGMAGTARGFADAPPEAPRAARAMPPPAERPRGGARWLWPVLGALALVALLWGISRRGPRQEPQTAAAVRDTGVRGMAARDTAASATRGAAVRDTQVSAGTVVDTATSAMRGAAATAGAAATSAAANLGSFVRRSLPGGVELNVPENGIESRLAGWIADPNSRPNDTTWFDFDRLRFATNSATLEPQSQEQLRNIAAILKAYPNVKAKVGGYTDNTGDPAANRRLSEQRAANVRQSLVTLGISGGRLTSEGYGDQHPVADNSTEAGRAQNRRIAMRVTQK